MVVSNSDLAEGAVPLRRINQTNVEIMRPKARARLVRASQVQARNEQLAAGEG
jgi:hypothetical protein